MKRNILVSFIIVFTVLIMISCEEEKVLYPLDQEIKDYTYFPIGTFWIYMDSLLNEKDTLRVIGGEMGTYESTEKDFEYEYFSQFIYSTRKKANMLYMGTAEYYLDYQTCVLNQYGNGPKFFSMKPRGYNYNNLIYEKNLDSLDVGQRCYNNIKVFKYIKTYTDTSDYERYYYVKKIGLIRKDINKTQEQWELIDFYLNIIPQF